MPEHVPEAPVTVVRPVAEENQPQEYFTLCIDSGTSSHWMEDGLEMDDFNGDEYVRGTFYFKDEATREEAVKLMLELLQLSKYTVEPEYPEIDNANVHN